MYNTSLTTAGLNPQSPEKNIYHLQMWRRGNALRCICLPVHNALTFESYDLESSFPVCIIVISVNRNGTEISVNDRIMNPLTKVETETQKSAQT